MAGLSTFKPRLKSMPFSLACADFTFPLLEHQHVLDLISMLRFDGIDIGLFEGRSHPQPARPARRPGIESGRRVLANGARLSRLCNQSSGRGAAAKSARLVRPHA